MVCTVAGKFFKLEFADAALSESDQLRRAGELEADVRKLLGMLSLPGSASELSKLSPYDSAENDLTEGPFLGGFMRITKATA
jgi:hypothetical protein